MTLHGPIGLLAVASLALTACPEPTPCVCPETPAATVTTPPAPAASPTPTVSAATPHAEDPPGALPGTGQLQPSGPEAKLALEIATALFRDRASEAIDHFTPALKADLSLARLQRIVAAVVSAHGPPVEVMDAWLGEVEEEGRPLRAAQVLLRMADEVRFRLLLIVGPGGNVDGLWLRPI
ncbi:MAG: hypothetical protein EP329_23770 [Deltaproteobacteria bacterium]|nr:MAG: hypothetical protein EP329_23770 [Deltaproteobacteria bacterium]